MIRRKFFVAGNQFETNFISFQYGTHEFPFIISVSPTCSYDNVKEVSMTMTDCDSGVSDSIKPFKYYEALSCICKE